METKELIIQTAKELFLSQGFKKTTTREIAEKASVNLGLIPYYFKKKEELARIVYQGIMRDLINLEEMESYPATNSIQRFFLYYALVQHHMLSEQGVFPLYIELIYEDVVAIEPQPYTFDLVRQVIEEYGLRVNEIELDTYVHMMKGVERRLTVRKLRKKIDLTYMQINELLVMNLLLMLGLDKQDIRKEIEDAKKILLKSGIDSILLQ